MEPTQASTIGDIGKVLGGVAALLWAGLAGWLLYLTRREVVAMLRNLGGIEAFGVKLALRGRESLDAAIALARKSARLDIAVPDADRARALERAKRERRLLTGAELLWIDDSPASCRYEARMLQSFGALITHACTTEEASAALRLAAAEGQPFHAIISDIERQWEDDGKAGLTAIPRIAAESGGLPIVLYITRFDPARGTPAGALGICDRPDRLLHLTLDALSRTRVVAEP